jgi:hypothetical protein
MDTSDADELDSLLIRHQADVHRMWELLMQPLGWRSTSLWVTFIGADRRPTRYLLEIAEADVAPTDEDLEHLYAVLEQVLREEGEGATIALLVARPGRDPLGSQDLVFCSRLLEGARRSGVPVEPVHVATDAAIWPVTPDDLAA